MPSSVRSSELALPPGIKIREHSWLARIAAWKLRSSRVALVLGNTIHLWGVNEPAFSANRSWLRHELMHVRQYRRHGILGFLIRYLYYSIRYGYYANPLEQEARAAE